MNRITYEERKEIYDKFRKERRNKIVATLLLGAVFVTATMLFMGCNTPPEESLRHYSEQPHPPRNYGYMPEDSAVDYEINVLNGLLNTHGITAFRIDPKDPEHQRRYRRHLEEPQGFFTIKETDI